MKIAAIDGTGLIRIAGVKILKSGGHEAVPRSLSTGVDLLTGQSLPIGRDHTIWVIDSLAELSDIN